MDITLPPALFYGVGAVLIVFGALRAYFLGWKQTPHVQRKSQPLPDGPADAPTPEDAAEAAAAGWSRAEGGGYKRHLTFGLLWVVMGLFLVLTTFLKTP
jgi:hypothetical protein